MFTTKKRGIFQTANKDIKKQILIFFIFLAFFNFFWLEQVFFIVFKVYQNLNAQLKLAKVVEINTNTALVLENHCAIGTLNDVELI